MGRMLEIYPVEDEQDFENDEHHDDGDQGEDGVIITLKHLPDDSWIMQNFSNVCVRILVGKDVLFDPTCISVEMFSKL